MFQKGVSTRRWENYTTELYMVFVQVVFKENRKISRKFCILPLDIIDGSTEKGNSHYVQCVPGLH